MCKNITRYCIHIQIDSHVSSRAKPFNNKPMPAGCSRKCKKQVVLEFRGEKKSPKIYTDTHTSGPNWMASIQQINCWEDYKKENGVNINVPINQSQVQNDTGTCTIQWTCFLSPYSFLLLSSSQTPQSHKRAGFQQPFTRILRRRVVIIRRNPLTERPHRSPTNRAIKVRVQPHIYANNMKTVLAPWKLPNLFTFFKNW